MARTEQVYKCDRVTTGTKLLVSYSSVMSNANTSEHVQGTGASSPPVPPGTQRLLPFIEAFLEHCRHMVLGGVKAFNKEDRARLLQFETGTSKVW